MRGIRPQGYKLMEKPSSLSSPVTVTDSFKMQSGHAGSNLFEIFASTKNQKGVILNPTSMKSLFSDKHSVKNAI